MNYEEVTSELSSFLENDDQKVFVLKGPWGVGKSHLVREYVANRPETSFSAFAFVSLFGLSSLKEVREAINANIEFKGKRTLRSTISEYVQGFNRAALKATISGVDVGSIGTSLFILLLKNVKSLIVFDDLERAGELKIGELLGLASNLGENTSAKVIIIFSDENLGVEDGSKLAEYREKVFDVEVRYRPDISKLVDRFYPHTETQNIITSILEDVDKPNIRLIAKLNIFLEHIRKDLKTSKVDLTLPETEAAAKVACLYLLSPYRFDHQELLRLRSASIFGDEPNDSKLKAFASLMSSLKIQPHDIDQLCISLLDGGSIPNDILTDYLEKRKVSTQRVEYYDAMTRAYSGYKSNFRATKNEVVKQIEDFLDQWVQLGGIREIVSHIDFIRRLGSTRDPSEWWRRRFHTLEPFSSPAKFSRFRAELPSDAVRWILDEVLAGKAGTPEPPLEVMKRIVRGKSWHPDDFESLNRLSSEELRNLFLSSDESELLSTLSEFLPIASTSNAGGPQAEVYRKLIEVLSSISKRGELDKIRVSEAVGFKVHGTS